MNKIKYTVSWTQNPQEWNIPSAIKMLEIARQKALALELENNSQQLDVSQAKLILEKFRLQK